MLFFDAAFNSPRGVRAAREAALAFLDESALPEDLVSVVTYNVVEGLRTIVPLTRDRHQIRAAVDGLGLSTATRNVDRAGFLTEIVLGDMEIMRPSDVGPTGKSPGARAADQAISELAIAQLGRAEFNQYASYVVNYADQIRRLGDLLQVIRGRKHVLFFTEGFDDRVLVGKSLDDLAEDSNRIQSRVGEGLASVSPEDRFGSAEVRSEIDEALTELQRADTLLHMVDVSGVGGGRDAGLSGGAGRSSFRTGGGTESGRSSLTVWAEGTGGSIVWNTNDIAGGLATIERSTREYYVLAIPKAPGDPDVLELDVRVLAEGVEVTSVASRLAPPKDFDSMSAMQRQAQLAEFISKGLIDGNLSFDTSVVPFVGRNDISRVPVVVEVPWDELEALAFAAADDVIELEILSYVLDRDGAMVDLCDGQVRLDLRSLRAGNRDGLPFRYYNLMWAGPGVHEVRTIVREANVGRISARRDELRVPSRESSGLHVDGPVAIDWKHPGMLLRGFDASAPPEHKADGPVSFPFAVGDIHLTPSAVAATSPGSVVQAYLVVNGLTRNPYNGRVDWSVQATLRGPTGRLQELSRFAVIEQKLDPETGGIQVLVGAEVPGSAESGFGELVMTINDGVAGKSTEASLAVWVGAADD